MDKAEFQSKLGPYNTALTSPQDDVFRSSNPDLRSTAIKVGTSGAVYPFANANPFFPAVGGTHKPIANTSDGITGTQPGGLDANSVYAGAYSEFQKGAVDPGPNLDFRYAIQNDQKWIYASPSGVAHSTPNNTDQKNIMFSSTATEVAIHVAATEMQDNAKASDASTVVTIPADNPVTCSTTSHLTSNGGGPNVGQLYTTATVNGRANMVHITNQTCVGASYTCTGGSSDGTESSSSECSSVGGSWAPTAVTTSAATPAEFACFFNRVQYIMTSNGGALSVGATTNMEPNFAIFYQLVLDLTSAAYGASYVDPVERTEAGSYSETGRSDASFKTMVETMKTRIDQVIGLHNTERAAIVSAMAGSGAYTHPSGYKTAYDSMIAYMVTFRDGIKNRITEITNRIGCLNGKNPAVSGNTAMQVAVGSAGAGFTGYSFNGGNGYANTVYSNANFLAGKKIKLFGKILAAISDVDTIYDQIKSKRAEYYEYNQ